MISKTLEEAPRKEQRCDVEWSSNASAADSIISNLSKFKAELQAAPSKKGGALAIRLLLPDPNKIPTSQDLQRAVQKATNCPFATVGEASFNSLISGKYKTAIAQLPKPVPGEKHPEIFYFVLVTSSKRSVGGTAGPGEDELVSIINNAGASVDNPINVVIGGKLFSGVTGAIKPSRSDAVGGEPKIDVLLLGKGGKGHRKGAFSLKLGAKLGGAPTYGGWSLFENFLPEAKEELKAVLKNYVRIKKPSQIKPGLYENVGNFAAPTSDAVADFAIYGNLETSGGKKYGKSRVDHVIEVFSTPTATFDEKGSLIIEGLTVHEEGDLFRGTEWEPFWLIRGASDRVSGLPPLLFDKTRIAVAPAQRAKQYSTQASKKSKSQKEHVELLKALIKEQIRIIT